MLEADHSLGIQAGNIRYSIGLSARLCWSESFGKCASVILTHAAAFQLTQALSDDSRDSSLTSVSSRRCELCLLFTCNDLNWLQAETHQGGSVAARWTE